RVLRGADEKNVVLEVGGATARTAAKRPFGSGLGGQEENAHDEQGVDGYQGGGLFMSSDAGETWKRINSINPRPMYFSQVRVDPSDDQHLWVLGVGIAHSNDGGKTFGGGRGRGGGGGGGGGGVHSDQHALWINPKDGRHMVIGCDGGFYATYDRGQRWDHMNHAGVISQFYHVAVSTKKPYWVFGGLQDNGSW